jgi:hypothetical protein
VGDKGGFALQPIVFPPWQNYERQGGFQYRFARIAFREQATNPAFTRPVHNHEVSVDCLRIIKDFLCHIIIFQNVKPSIHSQLWSVKHLAQQVHIKICFLGLTRLDVDEIQPRLESAQGLE